MWHFCFLDQTQILFHYSWIPIRWHSKWTLVCGVEEVMSFILRLCSTVCSLKIFTHINQSWGEFCLMLSVTLPSEYALCGCHPAWHPWLSTPPGLVRRTVTHLLQTVMHQQVHNGSWHLGLQHHPAGWEPPFKTLCHWVKSVFWIGFCHRPSRSCEALYMCWNTILRVCVCIHIYDSLTL